MKKNKIVAKAFGKLNLTFYITGRREDGYHTVNSLMQSIDLCDVLHITLREDKIISVTADKPDLNGPDNIAYKAAEKFFAVSGIAGGADIYIEKHIPVKGGLGGGSADAAAVLGVLNEVYNCPIAPKDLFACALSLGADVPFCLQGGTVSVKGVGEELQPMPYLGEKTFLLVSCGEKQSTAQMYRKIDENTAPQPADVLNCFEPFYDCSSVKRTMRQLGATAASLSGSGPYFFGMFPSDAEAGLCCRALHEEGIKAILCKSNAVGYSWNYV